MLTNIENIIFRDVEFLAIKFIGESKFHLTMIHSPGHKANLMDTVCKYTNVQRCCFVFVKLPFMEKCDVYSEDVPF